MNSNWFAASGVSPESQSGRSRRESAGTAWPAERERRGKAEQDEGEQRVEPADPLVGACETCLEEADDRDEEREQQIDPGQPGDQRAEEDNSTEPGVLG